MNGEHDTIRSEVVESNLKENVLSFDGINVIVEEAINSSRCLVEPEPNSEPKRGRNESLRASGTNKKETASRESNSRLATYPSQLPSGTMKKVGPVPKKFDDDPVEEIGHEEFREPMLGNNMLKDKINLIMDRFMEKSLSLVSQLPIVFI